jgi:hypothetical protein
VQLAIRRAVAMVEQEIKVVGEGIKFLSPEQVKIT